MSDRVWDSAEEVDFKVVSFPYSHAEPLGGPEEPTSGGVAFSVLSDYTMHVQPVDVFNGYLLKRCLVLPGHPATLRKLAKVLTDQALKIETDELTRGAPLKRSNVFGNVDLGKTRLVRMRRFDLLAHLARGWRHIGSDRKRDMRCLSKLGFVESRSGRDANGRYQWRASKKGRAFLKRWGVDAD